MAEGFLSRMAAASRARAVAARQRRPEAELRAAIGALPAPPALRLGDFDLIAEVKRRSPSEGTLSGAAFDPRAQLEAYIAAGVACVSVLTEPDEFHGSLAHLREATVFATAHGVPVMRKDFLTDPYQVLEAREAGASGVLVIVTMLSDDEVATLVAAARECGLFVLLEAFDAADLGRIERLGFGAGVGSAQGILAGVNCRNLQTLGVDFARFAELAQALPPGLPTVAESGILTPDDAGRVAALGYCVALVGSALMRDAEPERMARALVAAGRAETAERGHRQGRTRVQER